MRPVVLYVSDKLRFLGWPRRVALVEFPQLCRRASSPIASPSSLPVPLRAPERLRGEQPHLLDPLPLFPVTYTVGTVAVSIRGSAVVAIAVILRSGDH